MRRPPTRHANAPLEAVLFLPLLIVMLAGMVTVTQVALTDSKAASAARNVAFEGRRTPYNDGPQFTTGTTGVGLRAIDDSLGTVPAVESDGGLILSGVELPITPMFRRFVGRLPAGRGAVAVVGDTWDHQTIRFEPHARLTLDPRVNAFGGGRIATRAFDKLASFGHLSGALAHGTDALTDAISQDGIAESDKGDGLQSLLQRLAEALKPKKKDWGLIRWLRQQISYLGSAQGAFNTSTPPSL